MKIFLPICICILLFSSCTPRIGSEITSIQQPLSADGYIAVLQQEDNFINDGIEIGTIRSGDPGFRSNCSYPEIISDLKRFARTHGANLIKIESRRNPDQWSTCVRIKCRLYKVPDLSRHEKEIEWSADRKLTWEDFKGKPETGNSVAALSHCGFSYETNRVTLFKKAKIYASSYFATYTSWVIPEQKNQEGLLAHEQAHFDINEIYVRQFRKKIAGLKLSVFNLLEETNRVYNELYGECIKRQDHYDAETNHGLLKDKQDEWLKQINDELIQLNEFRN